MITVDVDLDPTVEVDGDVDVAPFVDLDPRPCRHGLIERARGPGVKAQVNDGVFVYVAVRRR